jgi:hypothetical protein
MNKNDHNYLSRIRENRLLRKQLDQDFESGKLVFESHSIAIIPDKYILVDIRHQAPDLYLDVLLQSLAILSRLNETLDYLQKQLHEQFYRIVLRTTQHIVDNNFVLHSNNSHQNFLTNNPDCLRDLLETCYEQFKIVVKNIEYLLNILKLIQEHQAPLQIQQQQYIGIQTAERQRGSRFFYFEKISMKFSSLQILNPNKNKQCQQQYNSKFHIYFPWNLFGKHFKKFLVKF